MYVDKNGGVHKHIILLTEDTEHYLKGWYFEDETGCFGNDEPYNTFEEAEEQLNKYFLCLHFQT